MNKNLAILLAAITFLLSCNSKPVTDYDTEILMNKISDEMNKFDDLLNKLYVQSLDNPNLVLSKIDSLFIANKNEIDPIKSQIKDDIEANLRYFKAEILYNIGDYNNSIKELKYGTSGQDEIGLVCNYVKLNKFEKANQILDSIPNYTFNRFIYANFYETIGKRNEALEIYQEIERDKGINHFFYYKLAVERIKELKKENPILLNSVYFPTGRPDFEVSDSDNVNRHKIMKLIINLPEVRNNWFSIEIYKAPKDYEKNYYWIKVNSDENVEKFNFFVYQNTFEIKYYDIEKNKIIELKDWRKYK